MRARALTGALALAVTTLAAAPAANASQLLVRGAFDARISVDASGRALVTYRLGGRQQSILAWGAINARKPSPSVSQVAFRLHYGYAAPFAGRCGRYDGPKLAWFVAACKAPDGSYWALQRWTRLARTGTAEGARELRLSHWRGELPVLEARVAWIHGRYHHLSGSFTYRRTPVYGFKATRSGSPLDDYGRNVYVDTYNSAYGPGWRRENAFLTRRRTGRFCYGFFARRRGMTGMGEAYRATVIGPGVTPDVTWQSRFRAGVDQQVAPCAP
jgi:hypothetical protein